MTLRRSITLFNAHQAHADLMKLWPEIKNYLIAGHRLELTVRPVRRSSEANARMWAMLGEVSAQVNWHGQKLSPDEWKDVMTAALKRQKVVPGMDGGFVVLGSHTSQMSGAEISEVMALLEAFGAEHGVHFKDVEQAGV